VEGAGCSRYAEGAAAWPTPHAQDKSGAYGDDAGQSNTCPERAQAAHETREDEGKGGRRRAQQGECSRTSRWMTLVGGRRGRNLQQHPTSSLILARLLLFTNRSSSTLAWPPMAAHLHAAAPSSEC